jgi:hypothetical protein
VVCVCSAAVAGAARARDAGGQQDGVRAAGLRAGAGPELRRRARPPPRGLVHARLHLQLRAQVHVHRHPLQGRVPPLHQGRLRDRAQEVRPAFSFPFFSFLFYGLLLFHVGPAPLPLPLAGNETRYFTECLKQLL